MWTHSSGSKTHTWRRRTGHAKELAGAAILVVEDDGLLSLGICEALQEAGAYIIGPFASLNAALLAAEHDDIDAAILDLDLQGELSFPVAESLTERHIPFLFHTGQADRITRHPHFSKAIVCEKPVYMSNLLAKLSEMLE